MYIPVFESPSNPTFNTTLLVDDVVVVVVVEDDDAFSLDVFSVDDVTLVVVACVTIELSSLDFSLLILIKI